MKKNMLLIIGCLVFSLNFCQAQKMTVCDCVTEYASMAEEISNGLSEEDAMKKYEKTEIECTKIMDDLGDEAVIAMSECDDWAKLSALMMPETPSFDQKFVCDCLDSLIVAYNDFLKNNLSDEKMEEKYAETLSPCEPLFMDESGGTLMLNCDSYPELMNLIMEMSQSE